MNRLERFAHVDADPDRFVYRKRTTVRRDGLEGLSLDELHPEPRTAVGTLPRRTRSRCSGDATSRAGGLHGEPSLPIRGGAFE